MSLAKVLASIGGVLGLTKSNMDVCLVGGLTPMAAGTGVFCYHWCNIKRVHFLVISFPCDCFFAQYVSKVFGSSEPRHKCVFVKVLCSVVTSQYVPIIADSFV